MQSMPGKGNLQLTGKLGEVIRESAQLALSWVKSNAFALGITSSESDLFLQDRDIHLHVSQIELEASAGSCPVLMIVSVSDARRRYWQRGT
jgi:ATP-dependent Lon protease